jgi:hypothetical protein
VEPRVFALDQAHLAAALVLLTEAARHPACRIDDDVRDDMASASETLRAGMDWRLLENAEQEPVLEWCDDTSSCGVPSVCSQAGLSAHTESGRATESGLRTFLAIADGDTPASYWRDGLVCDVATDGELVWMWTYSDYGATSCDIQCEATFKAQVPFLFLDPDALPKIDTAAGPLGHRASVRQLMRAHGIGDHALTGWTDSNTPDGSAYVVGCGIPADVVTPQASLLGVEFLPEASATVCAFVEAGANAPYELGGFELERGFRDSLRVATDGAEPANANYLPLDQARIALALMNLLFPDFDGSGLPVVRALFGADTRVAATYAALAGQSGCGAPGGVKACP